ncbi:MAG: IS200/IS605 family transposase [Saprospiraceae bacterium]|nr:IS200/IS605 family transposase [Saprospiraceae bacterium]
MGDTYSKAYFHLVFAVKNRQALIGKQWRVELEKYISGIIKNHGHSLLALYAMPDHIHILIRYNLNNLIPKLVEEIKVSSNHWINQKGFTKFNFQWQKGYGAFSHSESNIEAVINYILNQEDHHKKNSFQEEYLELLQEFKIDFKNEYLFDFFDESSSY